MCSLISDLVSANKGPGTSIFCKDGGLSGIFQGLLRFFFSLRQSVPQPSAQEYVRTRVVVGHEPQMRGCNTANPSRRLRNGVSVGHFGGREESRGEREERAGERACNTANGPTRLTEHIAVGHFGETGADECGTLWRQAQKHWPDILVVKFLCTNFTTI